MTISRTQIQNYRRYLVEEERSEATIEKYMHDITEFAAWLADQELIKEQVAMWKCQISKAEYAPASVNAKLSAVNGFLRYIGREDCRVRFLKVQRRVFRDPSKELTQEEYNRMVETARELGKDRLLLLMETICATGIRVSEVKYITVEAVNTGRADISLKGKVRAILLPQKLCRKLRKYAKKRNIRSGQVFLTQTGKPMTRTQIWSEMKKLCKKAGVEESKVFPHNLRHLFARAYYRACHDIVHLADILGHSSIETTRIYLISTGAEHARQMERLGLVS